MIEKIKSFLKNCFSSKNNDNYSLEASVISVSRTNSSINQRPRFHGVNLQEEDIANNQELNSISRQEARENTKLSDIPENVSSLSESESVFTFDNPTESIITNTEIMLETMEISEIILDQSPSSTIQRPSCVPALDLSKIVNSDDEEYDTARSK